MLHAVYRVGNLEYTNAFLGSGDERSNFALELTCALAAAAPAADLSIDLTCPLRVSRREDSGRTALVAACRYNYGKESYDLGSGFGHFALAVPDVYKTVESIKSAGGGRETCLTMRRNAGLGLCLC